MTDATNELPVVAGHVLREVFSMRWGYLVHVGGTTMAYKTVGAASAYARQHPLAFEDLIREYGEFGRKANIGPMGSADEHLFDERLSDEQRLWLVDFVRRWESVAEFNQEESHDHG